MALDGHHSPCWGDPDPGDCGCEQWNGPNVTDEMRELAAARAASILFNLSGRRWGVCSATIRPCGRDCDNPAPTYYAARGLGRGGGGFTPQFNGTTWTNTRCPCPAPDCSCCHVCQIELPGGPAQEIVQVVIGAETVDPGSYRIDNHRWLVRTEGECWPRCQNLAAGPGEDGYFAVTYKRGLPLDAAAMGAFSSYACEFLKACLPGCECRLPKRVQTIARQGTTVTFNDPDVLLDRGRTGIEEVDLWLAAVNPKGLRERGRVYSPDLPPARTTTWP